MITSKDIKALEKASSKKMIAFVRVFPPLMALTHFILGCTNLHMASQLAQENEMNLKELFFSWMDGYDFRSSYSGIYCLAVERLSTGIMVLFLAIMFLFLWVWKTNEIKRSKRILNHLKQNGCEQVDSGNG